MSAWIDKRVLPPLKPGQKPRASDDTGVRYDVKYRQGGGAYKSYRAGTFRSKKDAVLRRDMVRGWLAQGKDPAVELNALLPSVSREKTIGELWPGWVGSLRDVGEDRKRTIGNAWQHIDPVLGHMTVKAVTVEDGLRLVRALEKSVAPSTLKLYYGAAKQFMDAQTDDNVLRSKLIRLPKIVKEDVIAMSIQEWRALREAILYKPTPRSTGYKLALAMDFIEVTGVRVGDAGKLLWADIDFFESRVRISKARGKSERSRWVGIPMTMRDEILERNLQPTDLVFPEVAVKDKLRKTMKYACIRAGLPHFHPHDLRHRRASVWLHRGMPITDVAARVGHADVATTLNVYAHVVASGEDIWEDSDFYGGKR